MFWRSALEYVFFFLAGGAGFSLSALVGLRPGVLLAAGLPVVAFLPPPLALGLLLGAWLGAAGFGKPRQEPLGLLERLEWRKQLQDAAAVDLLLLTGLVYAFRQRAHASPFWVLATGLFFLLVALFSYFYTAGRRVPKRLRAVHGYLVGVISFLPWAYPLARWSWTAFGLGFVSFLVLPAFFLTVFDLKPRFRARRRPRRFGRAPRRKFRPGRRLSRPAGLGRP
ncbi:MAG: hypothetical protein ACUVRM_02335 [Bacillota bacterium]